MTSENDSSTTLDTALRFDAVDLVGRTGSHRRVERAVPAPAREAGGIAMQVPEGQEIAVEAELESVVEGVYVHGTAVAHLEGECSRCLDPVEQDVTARIDELFMFPEKVRAEEKEDTVLLEDDDVNLGPLVRDALAMAAEERPLCREDCPGLCGQCGARMEDDPDHHHDVIDDRFAALKGLFDEEQQDDEKQDDEQQNEEA
ncbi:YceD family protein [Brachybacterium sp. AOP43-C2-M15]|uniref:YceD family protein n=1 Tax=Brachybacterium sp. AOP43-C2-M15 TaxID=3457661 RepID=UPI004034A4BD